MLSAHPKLFEQWHQAFGLTLFHFFNVGFHNPLAHKQSGGAMGRRCIKGKDFGFGKINAGSLEASNTDITAELTLLLRAQQAFNGSAKMMQADADVTRRLMDT